MNALERLVRQTEQLAAGVERLPSAVAKAAADVVQASIERQIGKDAPHRKVAGRSVGVQQRVLSAGQHPSILVKAKGALHLLANPTQAHVIQTRKAAGSRRKASGATALRTPYGPRYAVHHPGTRGKDTWRQGVNEARPLVGKTAQTAVEAQVVKAFR